MILLREIQQADLESLERLAQIPGFINLQNDRDFLSEKIQRSRESFSRTVHSKETPEPDESKYIFVAEDLATRSIVGTSMVAAQHGTEESPHFYFEVGSEEKVSKSIGTGFIHGTLNLHFDTNGPSEIGGLVTDPSYRNSEARIGRQVSFARFLYISNHRERFKSDILAELLPPLNKKGQSPLWEAIGRRFTNMDYWEADRLCQQDKEFIFSLFPEGKIYTTFLTAEARNAIGKVGKDTEPVLHMLKKIGFHYKGQVDPFDGGPHLWAKRDDIVPIKKSRKVEFLGFSQTLTSEKANSGLISRSDEELGIFRAVHVEAMISEKGLTIFARSSEEEKAVQKSLRLLTGEQVVFLPYY